MEDREDIKEILEVAQEVISILEVETKVLEVKIETRMGVKIETKMKDKVENLEENVQEKNFKPVLTCVQGSLPECLVLVLQVAPRDVLPGSEEFCLSTSFGEEIKFCFQKK